MKSYTGLTFDLLSHDSIHGIRSLNMSSVSGIVFYYHAEFGVHAAKPRGEWGVVTLISLTTSLLDSISSHCSGKRPDARDWRKSSLLRCSQRSRRIFVDLGGSAAESTAAPAASTAVVSPHTGLPRKKSHQICRPIHSFDSTRVPFSGPVALVIYFDVSQYLNLK